MKSRLRDNQTLIVHVGLGKTGTTTLQSGVFPRLAETIDLAFNPSETQRALNRMAEFSDYSCENCAFDFRGYAESTILLSDERLVGWNPEFWAERCLQIEELFGASTTILITLRDPESYLRSMFQQQVHQGNVVKPHDFFLTEREFKKYQNITRARLCEICNADALNYEQLVRIFTHRFARVIVLPFPDFLDFEFLTRLVAISSDQLSELRGNVANESAKNRGYSRLAMRLTFFRECILNTLGLKSLGTHDRFRKKVTSETDGSSHRWKRFLRAFVTWRGLMQVTLPQLTGYRPYCLPQDVYRGVAYERNIAFFERLKVERFMEFIKGADVAARDERTEAVR